MTMEQIKVCAALIPDADYETGCSILNTSVKRFFGLPGVKQEYEEWMKTEEGQRADLSPKERRTYDEQRTKKRTSKNLRYDC